jgi:acyl-CoA reductase-like NAD-dependent aldehyde dehydrogenase
MSDSFLTTTNPATGEIVAEYACSSPSEIDKMCLNGKNSFTNDWRHVSPDKRSHALEKIAQLLWDNADKLAELEASDTGKSISTALSDVNGAIKLWEYAATLARVRNSDAFPVTEANGLAFTTWEPIGLVGMIVPWNYPLITTSERLPFALAAGCSVILKPSELAVGSLAFALDLITKSSLLPKDVLQICYGRGAEAGQTLCENQYVDMISFVGSTKTGRVVESTATKYGKRVSSEMGGNNVVLVYADADIHLASRAIISGGFRNGGQACIAGTHVVVDNSVADQLLSSLTEELTKQFPVDCQDQCKSIQPMITIQHKERIQDLIRSGIDENLVAIDGSKFEGQGNRIGPVIFKNVSLSSELFKEEIFGPIITVTGLNEDGFIDVANGLNYGLACYAYTASSAKAIDLSNNLRIGRIWVNTDPDFWMPELPVGGFGYSGTGRELGPNALNTYSLTKSIIIS